MTKYHVNKSGEPGPCKAKNHCPFGDMQNEHYDSPAEARDAYEKKQQSNGQTVTSHTKPKDISRVEHSKQLVEKLGGFKDGLEVDDNDIEVHDNGTNLVVKIISTDPNPLKQGKPVDSWNIRDDYPIADVPVSDYDPDYDDDDSGLDSPSYYDDEEDYENEPEYYLASYHMTPEDSAQERAQYEHSLHRR